MPLLNCHHLPLLTWHRTSVHELCCMKSKIEILVHMRSSVWLAIIGKKWPYDVTVQMWQKGDYSDVALHPNDLMISWRAADRQIAFIKSGGRAIWRRGSDSNRRIEVLQTSPLATWVPRLVFAHFGSDGADDGIWTHDLLLGKQTFYHWTTPAIRILKQKLWG